MNDNSARVIEIDINEILPNRFQPRIKFDEEEILELSDSIKEHGVIQPIVVRPIGDKYEIIAGERRYKASVLAGKETVPVIIKNLNDKDSAEIALIENIQRKNLTPIEEALSYKKILDMGYITQENLAVKLGKSQPAVANKIRLLNLSDEVQEALLENKISERHARSLLKLSTSSQQNQMLNRIINERLTVRRADEEIEKMKNSPSDGETSDSQKIKEKGEMNMNNNMFGMPNIPQEPMVQPTQQPTVPTFNIFGTENAQQKEPITKSEPVIEAPVIPTFDIFGTPSTENFNTSKNEEVSVSPIELEGVMTSQPEVPVEPVIETPTVPESESITPSISDVPTIDFNFEIPSSPIQSEIQSIPEVQPITEQTVMSEPIVEEQPTVQNFGFVSPNFEQSVMEAQIPVMQPIVESPVSAQPINNIQPEQPIVDSQNIVTSTPNNMFSFEPQNSNNVELTQSSEPVSIQSEFKMPEPIIVTDYSKQYDPIMPTAVEEIKPVVDFKEVINAIRECSGKIEQYGFKIDVEEYDLTNLYQVIFKIEKQ